MIHKCKQCGAEQLTRRVLKRTILTEAHDEDRGGYCVIADECLDEQVYYPCDCGEDKEKMEAGVPEVVAMEGFGKES